MIAYPTLSHGQSVRGILWLAVFMVSWICGNLAVAQPVPNAERRPVETGPGEWVDLLAWSEGINWHSLGIDWNGYLAGPPTAEAITLVPSHVDAFERFPLPAVIEGGYDAEFEFVRKDGKEGVGIFFPVGPHTVHLILGRRDGTQSVLSSIAGKNYDDSPVKAEHLPLANGVPHRFQVRVRTAGDRARIEVDFDQRAKLLEWSGPLADLENTESPDWRTMLRQHLWLTAYKNETTFRQARLRMQTGMVRPTLGIIPQRLAAPVTVLRLVEHQPVKIRVGSGHLGINQIPNWSQHNTFDNLNMWPMVNETPRFCTDYYSAHAHSELSCNIPQGARSFAAIAYNAASRTVKFRIEVDGKLVDASNETPADVMAIDIPEGAKRLTLIADPLGNDYADHAYWCYPQFFSTARDRIPEIFDERSTVALPFKFDVLKTAHEEVLHNKPFREIGRAPLLPDCLVPCHEFLFAHAPSSLVYELPEGATRFEAIGYCPNSSHVKYQVLADGKLIHETPQTGLEPIVAALPPGTRQLELRVDDLGNISHDRAMWCYPRVYYPGGTVLPPPVVPQYPPTRDTHRLRRVNYQGHQYAWIAGNWTFEEARRVCAQQGGQLAMINTPAEGNVLRGLLQGTAENCWIDARFNATTKQWTWGDGRAVSEADSGVTLAADGTSLHAGFSQQSQNWSSFPNETRAGVLCEWEKQAPGGLEYQPPTGSAPWTALLNSQVDRLTADPRGCRRNPTTQGYTIKWAPGYQDLRTKDEFRDFELECEFRFPDGQGNSGVKFRNQLEIELERGMFGATWDYRRSRNGNWGSIGTPPWIARVSGWNKLRLRVAGPQIQVWLNDVLINEFKQPAEEIETGPIQFLHTTNHNLTVEFREIRIRSANDQPLVVGQAPATAGAALAANTNTGTAQKIPEGEPINLIPLVKLPEQALVGRWKHLNSAIVCEAAPNARFFAPVAVTGTYKLNFEFTRRTGDDVIILLCPVGPSLALISVSVNHGESAGLINVPNYSKLSADPKAGVGVRPGTIPNGKLQTLSVVVNQTRTTANVLATLNGVRFISWRGPVTQLNPAGMDVLPLSSMIGVVSHNAVIDVHKLELMVQRGEGYQLGDDFANPINEVLAEPPPAIANQCLTWNGKKYFISGKPMNYASALALARVYQGRLLTISSRAEQEFFDKEGRGLPLWLSAWRSADSNVWKDERNRPLEFAAWAPGQPQLSVLELGLGVHTTTGEGRGWHDYGLPDSLHACIEWGEEPRQVKK